ncbi:MAG: transcription factor TFIIIB subunit brf1 [Bogoriella megaspora]|nr:MAG: transcription factor TFIIIB subunit brf1 [Bogoriella megaspora]
MPAPQAPRARRAPKERPKEREEVLHGEEVQQHEDVQQRENTQQTQEKQDSTKQTPTRTQGCPDCPGADVLESDGVRVCSNCGNVISEQNIVAEVQFGENAAGGAVVQGGYVGEGQRHAKTLTGPLNRKVGGQVSSRELTLARYKQEITKIAASVGLAQSIQDGAMTYMRLAHLHNFTYGRPVQVVVAVALYLACRTDKENQTLLIDLADAVQTNCYKLGQQYRELAKCLFIKTDTRKDNFTPFVEVEKLILKYAKRLEFGSFTYKVAEDATKIIKRMKRDWMVTGRRPAGLCGACLILAARMNNFRRTVREVVYVVKVADMTILKRLDEFDRTTSGGLTVDQFRQYGSKLKTSHDPPALFDKKIKEGRKQDRLERKRTTSQRVDAEFSRSSETPSSWDRALGTIGRGGKISQQALNTPGPSQEVRRDADGFLIPARPTIDPALSGETSSPSRPRSSSKAIKASIAKGKKRKRTAAANDQAPSETIQDSIEMSSTLNHDGAADTANTTDDVDGPPRKKKARRRIKRTDRPDAITISQEDLIDEEELEHEIQSYMHSEDFLEKMAEVQFESHKEYAKKVADERLAHERKTQGQSSSGVSDTEIVGEDEFANDPEVNNCLLSEEEIKIKERIWVTFNEDWLRDQQDRLLKKALADAAGVNNKKVQRKKKTYKRGDGSSASVGGTPARDSVEATKRMLNRYGNKSWSSKLDYETLERIYGQKGASSSGSQTAATSRAGSENVEGGDNGSEAGSEKNESRAVTPKGGSEEVVATSPPPAEGQQGEHQAQLGATRETAMLIEEDFDNMSDYDELEEEVNRELEEEHEFRGAVRDATEDTLDDVMQDVDDGY